MTKTVVINDISYPVYADLEDANTYNNAIVGNVWSSLNQTTKKQYLVMATRSIDTYNYAGEKIKENQPLKFPRKMSNGKTSNDDVLINLCCQLATYYYTYGSSSSGEDVGNLLNNVKSYQVGDLHLTLKDNADIDATRVDDIIKQALKGWMLDNGMEIWL